MRAQYFLTAGALLAASVGAVDIVSPIMDALSSEPELTVSAAFPESNPFGHVINGENNRLNLNVENTSGKNTTLLSVAGGFYNPAGDGLIKATSNLTYGIPLMDGAKVALPYSFHSELRTGEVKLHLDLEHFAEGKRYRVDAYDSIVTVVEPEISIFDFKMLSTYAAVLGLVAALGYIAYISFVPQPKKSRRAPAVSTPVAVTATGAGGYQEEWIPAHHLKKSKKTGAVSSGDEFSGVETSGTEGRKRKGRK